MPRQRSERTAIPLDDGRQQLRDDDGAVLWQEIERRAKGEPHAEPADEHVGLLPAANPRESERRQRLFRAVHAARHQALAVRQDHVLAAAQRQRQFGAVRGARLAEQLPGFHKQDSMRSILPC